MFAIRGDKGFGSAHGTKVLIGDGGTTFGTPIEDIRHCDEPSHLN
jgi:hypothetical protein